MKPPSRRGAGRGGEARPPRHGRRGRRTGALRRPRGRGGAPRDRSAPGGRTRRTRRRAARGGGGGGAAAARSEWARGATCGGGGPRHGDGCRRRRRRRRRRLPGDPWGIGRACSSSVMAAPTSRSVRPPSMAGAGASGPGGCARGPPARLDPPRRARVDTGRPWENDGAPPCSTHREPVDALRVDTRQGRRSGRGRRRAITLLLVTLVLPGQRPGGRRQPEPREVRPARLGRRRRPGLLVGLRPRRAARRAALLGLLTHRVGLVLLQVLLVALAVLWAALLVDAWRLGRPDRLPARDRRVAARAARRAAARTGCRRVGRGHGRYRPRGR